MRSRVHIDALELADAKVQAGVSAAQASHQDATLLVSSVQDTLTQLRHDLSNPATGQQLAALVLDQNLGTFVPPRMTSVPAPQRTVGPWLAAAVAVAGFVAFGAMMVWPPTGVGSADAHPSAALMARVINNPFDTAMGMATLTEASPSEPGSIAANPAIAGSQLYAGLFAKTDVRNLRCLAEAIYYEARGEAVIGQMAVAQVVLNRVRAGRWPKSICGVVQQGLERGEKCQFSYVCQSYRTPPVGLPWEQAKQIANDAVQGRAWLRELVEATHYHAVGFAPVWRLDLQEIGTFGKHIFYASKELVGELSLETANVHQELKIGTPGDVQLPSFRDRPPEMPTASTVKLASAPHRERPAAEQVARAKPSPATSPGVAKARSDWSSSLDSNR